MPPCPGSMLPLSLMPRSRFRADIVTSPANPARPRKPPTRSAGPTAIGVSHGAIKAAISADDQHRQRQEEEHVDRDENDEHPVPGDADPIELNGHGEVDEEEHAAVGAARRNEREVFLERQEADESEEDERERPVGSHRQGE